MIFFHFDNSKNNQCATNALYKIFAKYIKWFRRKVDFSGLAILPTTAKFDYRAARILFFLKPCSLVMLHIKN